MDRRLFPSKLLARERMAMKENKQKEGDETNTDNLTRKESSDVSKRRIISHGDILNINAPGAASTKHPAEAERHKKKKEKEEQEECVKPVTDVSEQHSQCTDWKPINDSSRAREIDEVFEEYGLKAENAETTDKEHDAYSKRIKTICSRLRQNTQKIELTDYVRTEASYVLCNTVRIPCFVWNRLLPFQKEGMAWLCKLFQTRKGGILADEMGLGKTVQITSFLAGLHFSRLLQSAIIVVPLTLVSQWIVELQKTYPLFRIDRLDSGDRPRSGYEIVVTSYSAVVKHIKKLREQSFTYAVLDEAHTIKNDETHVNTCCSSIPSANRIVLTGTPIQNRLKELWCIMQYVNPGLLGPKRDFEETYEEVISKRNRKEKTSSGLAKKRADELRNRIHPYVLRRTKEVLVNLPQKKETVVRVGLNKIQRRLYKEAVESSDFLGVLTGKTNVFIGIDRLRKICNHPNLLRNGMEYDLVNSSSKVVFLLSLLEMWRGKKTLVFSQTRQMLSIIEKIISKEYKYLRMDGTTPVKERKELIEKFNTQKEAAIFLLTTKVGGQGINLTGGCRVVLYDLDWNPSNDAQAKERVWRIGQHEIVEVVRLITKGTIEERIFETQAYKELLSGKILRSNFRKRLSSAQTLNSLFVLEEEDELDTLLASLFSMGERSAKEISRAVCRSSIPITTMELCEKISRIAVYNEQTQKWRAKPKQTEECGK